MSTDAALYAETARLIKRECDIVLFPTLGANALPTVQERIAHVVEMASDPATRADCVPADMITTNMDFYDRERKQFRGSRERIYLNTTKMLEELCESVKAVGVRPVAMMWNIAGIRLTQAFIEMGHVTFGRIHERRGVEVAIVMLDETGDGTTGQGRTCGLGFFPPQQRSKRPIRGARLLRADQQRHSALCAEYASSPRQRFPE